MNATGLSDLMDRLLGATTAKPLAVAGTNCATLAGKYTDEQHGSQMIATYFWWSFSRSTILPEVLRRAFGLERAEPVVVAHASGTRFSLLLMDPTYTGPPRTAWLGVEPGERFVRYHPGRSLIDVAPRLISAAVRQEFGRRRSIQDTKLARDVELSTQLVLKAVEEVGRADRLGIALVAGPTRTPTAGTGTPTPAAGVHSKTSRDPHASIGYTGSRKGKPYGTTALHALDGEGKAYVKGAEAPVLSTDRITDSAVLALPGPLRSFCGLRGPMTGNTPRLLQEAHFHGATSAEERVVINGYTANIVQPEPSDAIRLFSEPHVSPGDSGAGLIDEDDHVIGFAIDHASFSVDHATASWAWAAQVLQRHGLA